MLASEEEGPKVGKTPTKGVRFADEVGRQGEREKTETATSTFATEPNSGGAKAEDVRGEMDSVDFDKATGTSTPLAEDSPSLAKRGISPDSQTPSGSANSSSAVEEGEEVLETAVEGEGVGDNSQNSALELQEGEQETRDAQDLLVQVSSSTEL